MSHNGRYSRRTLLKTTGAGFVTAGVAGCTGGNGADSIRYLSRGGSTQDAEREIMEQWTEESGITVEHQEIADDTEMMNLIAEQPDAIDFTNPAAWGFYYEEFEFDGELLAELDFDEFPTYGDVIRDEWQEAPLIDWHNKGAFYYISTQGIGYNTEEADINAWQDIKDEQYEDQVTLFDSGPARFGNAAATLGYEPAEAAQDDAMFEEVIDEIEEQDVNAFNYWQTGDEMMRLLREERATVASAWGGRVDVLQNDGVPVEYVIPEEGAVTWSTGFSIVEESDNKDAVYDFLDWVYQPENLVELNQMFNYPSPIEDPPQEVREIPDYVDSPDDLAWIDFSALLPRFEELEQRLAEIQAS